MNASLLRLTAVVTVVTAWGFTGTFANAQGYDLIVASRRGDLNVVTKLLKSHADVNVRDAAGGTALIEASSNGHRAVVQALLAAKAEVNATRDGEAALFLASSNGHLDVVQALLAAKADVDAKCCDGVPPQYMAVQKGFREYHSDGHSETVTRVVAVKANEIPKERIVGTTALMMALANGHLDVARALLAAGPDVNAMSSNGVTPLILAARGSGPESLAMVRALLAAHADVNGGFLPGRTVAQAGWPPQEFRGGTALTNASSVGSADIVQALLAVNSYVNVNPRNDDGDTPLIVASANGHADVVRLLLAAKAEVNAEANNHYTALMWASANGHLEVVQLLLAAHAEVNAKRGVTALTLALRNDHPEVANLLNNANAAGK